jgi:hypothetical protein
VQEEECGEVCQQSYDHSVCVSLNSELVPCSSYILIYINVQELELELFFKKEES